MTERVDDQGLADQLDTNTPPRVRVLPSADSNGGNRVYWEYGPDSSVWELIVAGGGDAENCCLDCSAPLVPKRNQCKPFWTFREFEDLEENRVCRACGGELERKDPTPQELLTDLGAVQRPTLAAVASLTRHAPYAPVLREEERSPAADPHPALVNRTAVSREVVSKFDRWSSANAATSSISRAVGALIDRGLLFGLYRGWVRYYGEGATGNEPRYYHDTSSQGRVPGGSAPREDVCDHGERPTLERVGLKSATAQQAGILAFLRAAGPGGER